MNEFIFLLFLVFLLTLCCPHATIVACAVFCPVPIRYLEATRVWHQSRDFASCALQCSTEHVRSYFGCGQRWGERAKFSTFLTSKRALLCGFTKRASGSHCMICTYRAVKALCIAGFTSLAFHEMSEQELKIENLTYFSILSLSPAHAAAVISSWWDASLSVGNMFPCCFGAMLLALHARLSEVEIQMAVGNKGLKYFSSYVP